MKPLLASLICALTILTATASAPVLGSYARLATSKHGTTQISRSESDEPEDAYYPMLIRIRKESAVDSLLSIGTVIFNRRDDILLACVPIDMVDKLSPDYGVCRAEMNPAIMPSLDLAREAAFVDIVHAGAPFDKIPAIDGSGVIAAFTDTGFDPHHPAFEGRVAMLSNYNAPQAYHSSAYTSNEIAEWITDSYEEYHATHVAGILAGGYKGNKMYGVAPGATIAATTSALTDVGILAGVEDIIEFAKKENKPAVINMSLSSNIGPHDGSDLLCRYLDDCAEEAVIVIASGNYGERDIYRHHRFEDKDGTPVQSFISFNSQLDYANYDVKGIVDIWGSSDAPITARIAVYDQMLNKYIYFSEPLTAGDGISDEIFIEPESHPEWGQWFSGYLGIAGEVSPENGRTNITLYFDTHTTEDSSSGKWARFYNALVIEGVAGEEAHIYTDGWRLFVRPFLPGTLGGSTDMSINNMSCGFNTITVGAASTRNSYTMLNGSQKTYDFDTKQVAAFTAYGTLEDGRHMPHIAAPGNYVISAASKPFFDANPNVNRPFTDMVESPDGTRHYWLPLNGTSMAAPFAAGVATLWLQVNPSLSGPEIRDIMQETARTGFSDIDNPRWGAGMINAYDGVKKIYAMMSSSDLTVNDKILVNVDGRSVEISLPGDFNDAVVSVYNMSGIAVANGCAKNSQATLEIPSPGVYILQAVSPQSGILSKKLNIR